MAIKAVAVAAAAGEKRSEDWGCYRFVSPFVLSPPRPFYARGEFGVDGMECEIGALNRLQR